MQLKEYSHLSFSSAELENGDQLPFVGSRYFRLSVPPDFIGKQELVEDGFAMIDRTICVKVPVTGNKIDFQQFCRMTVIRTDEYHEEIRDIARASFRRDYRFRTTISGEESRIYNRLIDMWMEGQEEVFVCLYKERAIGFADVRCMEEYDSMPFIYLAAVDEQYRAAGAAMSLYAAVFEYYKGQNIRFVYGKISSENMAVMNLYAAFGAQFFKPCDIYIKEGGSIDYGDKY